MQEMDETEQAVYDSLMPEYHSDRDIRYAPVISLVDIVVLFVDRMRDQDIPDEEIKSILIPIDRR